MRCVDTMRQASGELQLSLQPQLPLTPIRLEAFGPQKGPAQAGLAGAGWQGWWLEGCPMPKGQGHPQNPEVDFWSPRCVLWEPKNRGAQTDCVLQAGDFLLVGVFVSRRVKPRGATCGGQGKTQIVMVIAINCELEKVH